MRLENGVTTPFVANSAAFPIRVKPISQSKRERIRRPAKVQFAMTGLVIGLGAGWVIGLVAEILSHRGMIVMLVGGFAGLAIGYLVEAVRFWWRKRKARDTPKI